MSGTQQIKKLVDDWVFGNADRAQSQNRFWLYIAFSIFFFLTLVVVSVLKR